MKTLVKYFITKLYREILFFFFSTPIHLCFCTWCYSQKCGGGGYGDGHIHGTRQGIVYFFSFTGLANFPDSTSNTLNLKIAFYLNGYYLSTAEVGESNTVQQSSSLTMQSHAEYAKGRSSLVGRLHQACTCGTAIITAPISLVSYCTKKCLSRFNRLPISPIMTTRFLRHLTSDSTPHLLPTLLL